MQTTDWEILIKRLSEPFPERAIYWRAGAVSKDRKRAQALPYADPRVYEDRLNQVCAGDWQVAFKPWGERRVICELSIFGVTRSSTGEENEGFAPGTAAEAQAFKRAASKFGLGRYLYDIPIAWVDFDAEKNRLLETPSLAEKFLPKDLAILPLSCLSLERAKAMASELSKLGFEDRQQLKMAASVLGRPIMDFTQLTEAEALEVWAQAKRLSRHVA